MKIIFTRHGESLANTLHIISNHDLPHPLTGKGRAQAAELADQLAGRPIQRVYASPTLRAHETAEIVAARLNLPLEVNAALKEYDCGELEGRGDEGAWARHSHFVHAWLAGEQQNQAPAGGESFFEIQQRLAGFVHGLVAEYSASEAEILCVSHGGTLLFGLPGLLTNLSLEWVRERRLGHTEIIVAENENDRLVCRSWGEALFA
jgi:broad specificity phosphatase PhoE